MVAPPVDGDLLQTAEHYVVFHALGQLERRVRLRDLLHIPILRVGEASVRQLLGLHDSLFVAGALLNSFNL